MGCKAEGIDLNVNELRADGEPAQTGQDLRRIVPLE